MDEGWRGQLEQFLGKRNFFRGGLALDLDGTALMEDQGRVFIPAAVEAGVRSIHRLGRPIIINTLRFPLSVMRTVGEAWYALVENPVPTTLLNGSILGNIHRVGAQLEYEEIAAFPMTESEKKLVFDGVREFLNQGIDDVLLFYYVRAWREGEGLWTPREERVDGLRQKFLSASKVTAMKLDALEAELAGKDVCMMSLFVDRPEDTLMAYQHSKRNSFFTRRGVDKASGLRELAKRLGVSLEDSIGAGDTEMDSFLSEVGLAVIVGGRPLPFAGRLNTVRVPEPAALGDLLSQIARLLEIPTAK